MKRLTLTVTVLTAGVLGLGACGGGDSNPLESGSSSSSSSSGGSGSESLTVGSADFSESVVLAEVYAGALRGDGIDASTNTNIGSREIYLKALEDGSIDLIPEYTGALAIYYDNSFDKTDPDEVYTALKGLLPDNLEVLQKSQAEDVDTLAVTRQTAQDKDLKTVGDLKGSAQDMTLGAPPEFKTRAQGVPGIEKTYGVTFGDFRPLKGQALVQALKNGQVDVANIFSTDPAIPQNDFVALEDTKKLFGSQNVVPLIAKDKATDEVTKTLNDVSAALTTEKLSDMLKQVDVDKKDPQAVAQQFLKDNSLS